MKLKQILQYMLFMSSTTFLILLSIIFINRFPFPKPDKPFNNNKYKNVKMQQSNPPYYKNNSNQYKESIDVIPEASVPDEPSLPLCERPTRFPQEEICSNQNLIDILGKLRKFCNNGKCDVESFLKNAKTIATDDFWKLLDQPSVYSFFYCSGKSHVTNSQFTRKAEELISTLGAMIAVPENTAIFMLGKASAPGDGEANRVLSAERVLNLAKRITDMMSKTGSTWGCDNVYQTSVGEDAFSFSQQDAQKYNFYNSDDQKDQQICRDKGSNFENYINQAVVVFTYPCLWEMCTSLFNSGKLSCDEAASSDLRPTDECRKLLCECSDSNQ